MGRDPVYTLSSYGIQPGDLPAALARRLPRYPLIPAILLGRLAVDARYRGQGVGRRLLVSALLRALAYSRDIVAFAVIVEAKDDAARVFYKRHGFTPFPDQPSRLYLPMWTIERGSVAYGDGLTG